VKVLLDTHTFIWLDAHPSELSPLALSICSDRSNELLISLASLWEMQIKLQLKKLNLRLSLSELVTSQTQVNRIAVLAVRFPHVLELAQLLMLHRDPFDRMLIAQARIEGATLLTKDAHFAQYPIQVVW
jgi:PIN domain nuclease of toxin-antitoxin system